MPIKIIAEKCIVDGKKCRNIISIEGVLRINELPEEYIGSDEPAFCSSPFVDLKSNDKLKRAILIFIYCKSGKPLLEAKVYREYEFQQILSYIRKAGDNLQRINQKLKLESWKGKEEFII